MPVPLISEGPVRSDTQPLAGMTVLVVEDSRFASEAVRLLCQKSGARIRRADSLRTARRHLCVYLPNAVIVDLGLPDGSGVELIRDLAGASPRVPILLATSADDRGFLPAIEAGADGVLQKPVESLAVFQKALLDPLPPQDRPRGPRLVSGETVTPDRVALRDDLAHIADVLTARDDDRTLDYVAQFLSGVALSARDEALSAAVRALAERRSIGGSIRSDLARVAGLLQERLEAHAPI